MTRSVLASLLGLGLWLSVDRLPADEPDGLAAAVAIQNAFVKAIESAEKSVVSIARAKVQTPVFERPRRGGREDRQPTIDDPDYIPNEFGAGIVIDENGLILTNYHLVRGGSPVEQKPEFKAEQMLYVRLPDRRGFEARIFAADPRSDLAVLKIAANDLKPIRLGNATAARKGQFVVALGNPYLIARDGSASATWGIISNLVRHAILDPDLGDTETRRRETLQNLGMLMQIDTRLDLGTSGGALVNLHGELIGITTSLASIVGYEKSAGFAVPVDDSTRRIIETLRQGKEVEYGFLGIVPENVLPSDFSRDFAPLAEKYRQNSAARIVEVVPNLPAQRAGLQANDLVMRVGDKPIYSKSDLMREIGVLAPATVVRMHVWRSGTDRELLVEIGKWPVVDEQAMITSHPLRDPWRGLVYDYPTARIRSFTRGNPPERNSGVLIFDVLPNSPAAALELHADDLITHVKGKPVHSPREFQELVLGETGPVQIQVLPGAAQTPVPRKIEIKPR